MIYVTELLGHSTEQVRPALKKHGRTWAYLWSDRSHAELDDFARKIGLSVHYLVDHNRVVRRCYWVEQRWRERALKGGALEGTKEFRERQLREERERVEAEKEAKKQQQREEGSKGGMAKSFIPADEGKNAWSYVDARTPMERLRDALPDAVVRSYPLGPEGDTKLAAYLDIWPEPERAARFIIERWERVQEFGERGASHEPSDGPPGQRICLKCRLKEPWWDGLYCGTAAAYARKIERARGEDTANGDATGSGTHGPRGRTGQLPQRGARSVVRA